jgi:hypothetical protein
MPINTITIHGQHYLLAQLGSATTHLVGELEPDAPSRPIVDRGYLPINPAFDKKQLRSPKWQIRTLCGRTDWRMAATDAGGAELVGWEEEAVFSPNCRQCLRVLDRQFKAAEPSEQLTQNVERGIRELELWGTFMIDGIPPDQMEFLRQRVRKECRKRGWKVQSFTRDGRLVWVSENSRLPERDAFVAADARHRMETAFSRRLSGEETQFEEPSWHFRWS